MYIFLKTAKRPTKNHHDCDAFGRDKPKSIKEGELFLAISNGTIGAGARQTNIGNLQAIEMLEEMLLLLKQNRDSNTKKEVKQDKIGAMDDIPF